MSTLLIIILIILLIGGLPQLGLHSYGYTPVSLGVVLLIILIILVATGRL